MSAAVRWTEFYWDNGHTKETCMSVNLTMKEWQIQCCIIVVPYLWFFVFMSGACRADGFPGGLRHWGEHGELHLNIFFRTLNCHLQSCTCRYTRCVQVCCCMQLSLQSLYGMLQHFLTKAEHNILFTPGAFYYTSIALISLLPYFDSSQRGCGLREVNKCEGHSSSNSLLSFVSEDLLLLHSCLIH